MVSNLNISRERRERWISVHHNNSFIVHAQITRLKDPKVQYFSLSQKLISKTTGIKQVNPWSVKGLFVCLSAINFQGRGSHQTNNY